MGSAAALNRESKCEDFIWNHRKAQMKSRWRVGASENEWQNVTTNFTLNASLDCSKKKGLQVTDLQCLRRNTELPSAGAAGLSSSASSAPGREPGARGAPGPAV